MPSMEEDYLERARDIWQQFQFYVYIGLAMILATITGFTLSHSAFDENRDHLNEQLYMLIDSADDNDLDGAMAAYEQLRADDEFNELDYLGAFVLSSLHFAEGDYTQAAELLRPTLDGSQDEGLKQIAALRMSEALMAGGEHEQAVSLLNDNLPEDGRLLIMFHERIGDAEFTAGNFAAALEAYETAQELARENASFYESIINIKISAMLSNTDAARAATGDASTDDDDAADSTEADTTNDSTGTSSGENNANNQ